MRLKAIAMKGFKSFPDRTRLDFGPGVSVVVGPNGSGKSNVTDAVLWAMGEQSPLAVRGQSMQDVIFGGGRGVQARSSAEVEIVLDNSDGTVDLPVSEISIVRRLDRSGEGEYRLNGAHCRLVDVIEVLSDTGLGKETHSVISQGRVESIVTSKPRERRLLIEEAAGLGKHRKRRRRAQLKLERTQENLDRALDVEREARTRLRPLKRQAEAAELHERLERQMLEARHVLAREAMRARRVELVGAEAAAQSARAARTEVEARLQAVVERRGVAERALAERAEQHDALARRAYDARSARERLELRREQVLASGASVAQRIARIERELESSSEASGDAQQEQRAQGADRIEALERELAEIEREHEQETERDIEGLAAAHGQAQAGVAELEAELQDTREAREEADARVRAMRAGNFWSATWEEVHRVVAEGIERALARSEQERPLASDEVASEVERLVRSAVELALKGVRGAEEAREELDGKLREAEHRHARAVEEERRAAWLIERRRAAPEQGPLAVRRAQLEGELAAERRQAEHMARERAERLRRLESLRAQHAADVALAPTAERLAAALQSAGEAVATRVAELEGELARDRAAGEQMSTELRACAGEEADAQSRLRVEGEAVTSAEVSAQRLRDQAAEAELELRAVVERLGLEPRDEAQTTVAGQDGAQTPTEDGEQMPAAVVEDGEQAPVGEQEGEQTPLGEEQEQALRARLERLQRRREQLGPVNPLAQEEYAEAIAHVEELESRRTDLETALRELRGVIRETDRQIQETFQATFEAAARNFEELVGDVFPGGSGRLRLVAEEPTRRAVLGGQSANGADPSGADGDAEADAEAAAESEAELQELEGEELQGVEIEITPAGKSTKRLSLLSGGEKSMTALAFLFAVFLARPCPFYILDEVEAALDDLNLDRFLALLRRYAGRAQFIVITHQKRTMEAADWLYGVSMGGDGVSKILSRRLPPAEVGAGEEAGETDTPENVAQASSPAVTKAA
ncbi:MAG: chromosome segregation SMC family protein [Solirubrobacterales bacterium]